MLCYQNAREIDCEARGGHTVHTEVEVVRRNNRVEPITHAKVKVYNVSQVSEYCHTREGKATQWFATLKSRVEDSTTVVRGNTNAKELTCRLQHNKV